MFFALAAAELVHIRHKPQHPQYPVLRLTTARLDMTVMRMLPVAPAMAVTWPTATWGASVINLEVSEMVMIRLDVGI